MSKQYAIMKDGKCVFGPVPEADYQKIVTHLNTFTPEERKTYKVVFTTAKSEAPAVTPPVTTPPAAVTPPAPVTPPVQEKVAPPVTPPAAQAPAVETPPATEQPADEYTFDNNATAAFSSHVEGGGSSEYWKPKDGKNLVRLLPLGGINPNDWKTPYPMLLSGLHPNVGLSMQEMVYCPRLTHNQACPICAFVWKLYNNNNEEDKALAKKIKSYKRILMNIIDLSDLDAGVQKYAFGKKLAGKIVSYLQDPDTRYVLHPDKGNNFILIKKTIDGYPNYDESRFEMKSTPLSGILPEWRKGIHDLRKDVVEKSYDELAVVLRETKKALLESSTDDVAPVESHAVETVAQAPAAADNQFGGPEGTEVQEVSLEELDTKLNNFK